MSSAAPVPTATAPDPDHAARHRPPSARLLLFMVLVIATTGLVYELAMATVASYVLGDSVRQFSTIIGIYLSALGLGAYLSRFVERDLELRFIDVELAAAVVGGLSAPLLFAAFGFTSAFHGILYLTVLAVGVLVGIELPLLMRILRRDLAFKDLVARALMYDYVGALVGSLGFSLVLMPRLGLVRTSILCGILNALVALASTWLLVPRSVGRGRSLRMARGGALSITVLLGLALVFAERFRSFSENRDHGATRLSVQSEYQRITLTDEGGRLSLHLNGALQFSSDDERRYHEALVHPAMGAGDSRRSVFIGGGGDGLAAREVLRWHDVGRVVLVDLDAEVTSLATRDRRLRALNEDALRDPRVVVANADAMQWLAAREDLFDVVLFDFPDPSSYSIGKLFSSRMFRLAAARLAPGGRLAIQATSPHATRNAYWCIISTMEAAGLEVAPYRLFVPSFGEWGFALATTSGNRPLLGEEPPPAASYLSLQAIGILTTFSPDTDRVAVRTQTLEAQELVGYYLSAQARGHHATN